MQLRSLWLACEFAELLAQDLLVFDLQILIAKKDDTALRDWAQLAKD